MYTEVSVANNVNQLGANTMKEFEATIRTQEYEKVNVSNLEDNLWMSIWAARGHCSTQLTREQVAQLRDALNAFLSQE
jgi:ABC-type phosphate transport system substrate-binding protein